MEFNTSPKLIQNTLTFLLVIAVFFLAVFGFFSGRDDARSAITVKNMNTLTVGLNLFFEDQNRYPSQQEFLDSSIMGNYFNNLPVPNYVSKVCPAPFSYETFNQKMYTLNFCIPHANQGFNKGNNSLKK